MERRTHRRFAWGVVLIGLAGLITSCARMHPIEGGDRGAELGPAETAEALHSGGAGMGALRCGAREQLCNDHCISRQATCTPQHECRRGQVRCGARCVAASECPPCGYGGPVCDPSNLGGTTCLSLGLGEGELVCDPASCTFDTSMCIGGSDGHGHGGDPGGMGGEGG